MTDRYPVETFELNEYGESEDNGTMPDNVAELERAIVGRRIVKVEQDITLPDGDNSWYSRRDRGLALTLDSGRRVFLVDTDDCCAYTELDASEDRSAIIKHLDQIDHMVMGVGTTDGYTTWHIYADLGDILELKVAWSCGNPFYYGYGFDIRVYDPEPLKELPGG